MTDFAYQNRTKLVATYEFLRLKRMILSSSVIESHFKLVYSCGPSQYSGGQNFCSKHIISLSQNVAQELGEVAQQSKDKEYMPTHHG